MTNTTNWKHRNLALFKTPEGLFKENTDAPANTLSDWNRQIASGNKCIYHINNQKLSELQPTPFETVEDLKTFLKANLLNTIEDETDQVSLTNMIISLAYQSGILHATSSVMTQRTGEMGVDIALRQPDMKIDLNSTSTGIEIIEENQYRRWCDAATGRKNHSRNQDQPYYAQTKTTYKITPDSVLLTDLTVDCPSRNLAEIFDIRPTEQQRVRSPVFKHRIAQIVDSLRSGTRVSNEEEESRVLYKKGV